MKIDRDAVERLAHLSHLSLSKEEISMFARDLDAIIGHARDLEAVDTDNVMPMIGAVDTKNIMRSDELVDHALPVDDDARKGPKAAFPEERGGRLKVPKIL